MRYPSGETVWVGYYDRSDNLLYIVTSKAARDCYFLYEVVGGEFKKIGKDKDPSALVAKYRVRERMYC